jgi:hypothetical protein
VTFFKNYFLTGFVAGLETGFATGFATGFEDDINEILLSNTFMRLIKRFVTN